MNNRPLNILIVASWYPSDNDPISGSFIQEQALMLKEYGHNVTVIHPQLKGTFLKTLLKRNTTTAISDDHGIKSIHIYISPSLPRLRSLSYKKSYTLAMKLIKAEIEKCGKFDLVHSHAMFLGGYIALRFSKEMRIPFYHTEHSSGLIFDPKSYDNTDKKIIHSVFNSARRVFFVSEFAKNETLKIWNVSNSDRFAVLPNIVEKTFFQIPLVTPSINPFNYLIIASLIPVKNVSLLIEAWKLLIHEFPNSNLTIAGEGYLKDKLELLVESLNLNNSIHFLPRLSREEVKVQLIKNNVLVSSSKIETFGLTVAEAQALGRPVIVTDSGGVRDIVTESTGIITGQSPGQLAKGLIEIQKNYLEYDPEATRETAKKKFSSVAVYNYLEKIYFNNSMSYDKTEH